MQTEQNAGSINLDPRFDPLATLDSGKTQNRWAKDDKLYTQFYTKPVMNPAKSTKANRAIYDEVDYIRINSPGSQLSVVTSPVVGTKYERRFAKEYAAWKITRQNAISGTPVEAFPFLAGRIGLVAELKAMSVHTVEQLADLSDSAITGFMGGIELRKRAQDWLESTTGTGAKLSELEKENQSLKFRLDMLEQNAQTEKPAPKPRATTRT